LKHERLKIKTCFLAEFWSSNYKLLLGLLCLAKERKNFPARCVQKKFCT